MPGTPLDGRYRLEAELARDWDATTYAGHDERMNRPVTVTLLAPARAADPAWLAACQERVGRLAGLSHPNLPAIYDSSLTGEPPFVVGPRLAGRTLRRRLAESGPLSPEAARRVGAQAASALAALHDQGLVHGRLDPDHLLLGDDGEVYFLGLLAPPASGGLPGRAAYEAPELALGHPADPRSDVFALSATLYEALMGRPAFAGPDAQAIALAKLDQLPPAPAERLPGLTREFSDAIMLGLSASAAQRPPDGARFALRLESATGVGLAATQAMAPTQVMAPAAPPPPPALPDDEPEVAGAGGALPWFGLLVVLLVVGGLWYALRAPSPTAPPLPDAVAADDTAGVPAVEGKLEQEALRTLRAANWQVTVTDRQASEQVPGGHVISQDPPAGSAPAADRLVKLVVSTGPRFVTVPQVVGLSEAEARKLLPKYGLTFVTQKADDPQHRHGVVVAQSPLAGQKVDKGRGVTIYVNQHADPEPEEPAAPADTTPVVPEGEATGGSVVDQATTTITDQAKARAGEVIDQVAEDLKQGAADRWDKTKEAARDRVREVREGVVEGVREKFQGSGSKEAPAGQ